MLAPLAPLAALCSLALLSIPATCSPRSPEPKYHTIYQQGEAGVVPDRVSHPYLIQDGHCDGQFDSFLLCPKVTPEVFRIDVTDQSDALVVFNGNLSQALVYRVHKNESGLCPGTAVVIGAAKCGLGPLRRRRRRHALPRIAGAIRL